MMPLINIQKYHEHVSFISNLPLEWDKFSNCTFLISGASGMIGSFLIDVLMMHPKINVIALGRNKYRAMERFSPYLNNSNFSFFQYDVNEPLSLDKHCDFIIHAASNTHPVQYAEDPIGTVNSNIIGAKNMLDFASKQNKTRFMFLSSVEIYGENRGDVDKFDEEYLGYLDCNTLRAGYPESKRCAEALCQAYMEAKHMDIVIPRLSRVYGPSMMERDSKAIAQFIKRAVEGKDIILKSQGTQLYSYTYVADIVSALLYILLHGKNGTAYNIATGGDSDIMLKDLAAILAKEGNANVIFELPDEIENKGYSKATKALLNCDRLKALGWSSKFTIKTALADTVSILKHASKYM